MKKWTMILVYMTYAIAVLAIIEGLSTGMYISGVAASIFLMWLGNNLKEETKNL